MTGALTADQIKAWCAAAYSNPLSTLLMGDSFHPGGALMTRRLASLAGLRRDSWVLDVGCGRGTTAMQLAREYGAHVQGVDLALPNVVAARNLASAAWLSSAVKFAEGDAESLPVGDAEFDTAFYESVFAHCPDKPRAAAEMARVLRVGGRAAIGDMTVLAGAGPVMPPVWGAWIGDGLTADGYREVLAGAGLVVRHTERHDGALRRMIDQIEARTALARMVEAGQFDEDIDQTLPALRTLRAAIDAGTLGYVLMVAEKT